MKKTAISVISVMQHSAAIACNYKKLPPTRETARHLNKISCIVSYCIALHCIALYCIALHCIVLHCIALYCVVLYCIALYRIVSYHIVSYCVVLCCIVLYCIVHMTDTLKTLVSLASFVSYAFLQIITIC